MNLAAMVGVMDENVGEYELTRLSLWLPIHTDVVDIFIWIAMYGSANNADKPLILRQAFGSKALKIPADNMV